MSEVKEITYEELSNYEKTKAFHGTYALRNAIVALQNTNNMRIVFREELASISEVIASLEEKGEGTL